MKGGKNRQSFGYTVVEVMIVLAVSGMMFIVAANFINGKQAKTAFNQGVNEMASRLQDTIEQVTDGRYSDIPLNCSVVGSSLNFSGPTKGQGKNQDCVFLGKIVHFYSADGSGQPQDYETFSLATARTATTLVGTTNIPNLTTHGTVPQRLNIVSMSVKTNGFPATEITVYNIGFAQGLGVSNGAGAYKSGAQTVGLVYATNLNKSSTGTGLHVVSAQSATICLSDDKRYAQISVGDDTANNNQLIVKVKMLGESTTC
jgi:hypothetical protein